MYSVKVPIQESHVIFKGAKGYKPCLILYLCSTKISLKQQTMEIKTVSKIFTLRKYATAELCVETAIFCSYF